MKIIPDGKKMIVLPIETEEIVTEGKLIIPEGVVTADISRGTVIEVSDGLCHKYSEGDVVLYATKAGQGIHYKGEWHLWLTEREYDSDIWGKEINE